MLVNWWITGKLNVNVSPWSAPLCIVFSVWLSSTFHLLCHSIAHSCMFLSCNLSSCFYFSFSQFHNLHFSSTLQIPDTQNIHDIHFTVIYLLESAQVVLCCVKMLKQFSTWNVIGAQMKIDSVSAWSTHTLHLPIHTHDYIENVILLNV